MYHEPVLLNKAVSVLNVAKDGVYVDCTLGGGGHFSEILKRTGKSAKVIGLDRDFDSIEFSRKIISGDPRAVFGVSRFSELTITLARLGINSVDGILMDLGVSSFQIDTAEKGFSFMREGPLSMKMGRSDGAPDAEELVNTLPEEKLVDIFRDYGNVKGPYAAAAMLVKARRCGRIRSTVDLADAVSGGKRHDYGFLAKIFQALRIAVNDEMNELRAGLNSAVGLLRGNGRLVVISYHSEEDRIVKNFLRDEENGCICPVFIPECRCGRKKRFEVLFRKPVRPDEEEITRNPRSRSALLRAAKKVEE
ncbi:MAG: 16S rRNA (cytosine(1402)-N(4))-methyltransferase RsmH [Fibrobacterota bacterium]